MKYKNLTKEQIYDIEELIVQAEKDNQKNLSAKKIIRSFTLDPQLFGTWLYARTESWQVTFKEDGTYISSRDDWFMKSYKDGSNYEYTFITDYEIWEQGEFLYDKTSSARGSFRAVGEWYITRDGVLIVSDDDNIRRKEEVINGYDTRSEYQYTFSYEEYKIENNDSLTLTYNLEGGWSSIFERK